DDGILGEMSGEDGFVLVAFSDEGLDRSADVVQPVRHYSDYNMLLRDPAVELVLADGPVDRRRDFAVRALNAGRHVVAAPPFCETALDAERVMKTALREGLVATMAMPWRREPSFRALLAALKAENAADVRGLLAFCCVAREQEPGAQLGSLLQEAGMHLLDQVNLLLTDEVKNASAHLERPTPRSADDAFLIYMPLRRGGWAVVRAQRGPGARFPGWVLYAGGAVFEAREGVAEVVSDSDRRTYDPPPLTESFWANVHAAVRRGEAPACHPADIVRAMKLHEAAQQSAELGEPVVL
ncbi:MAG: Gfo/Idh/MocA family protein, partial [Planctomycetota bacterium]